MVEPQRRGWALGIHQIGGTLSNLTAPLIAAGLATFLGWQSAFVIPGIVVFILGIVLYWLLGRTKPTAKPGPDDDNPVRTQSVARPHRMSSIIMYIIIGTAGQVFILSTVSLLPLFMVDHLGESEGIAAAFQFIVYLGGMPAGPLAGYISDRVGAHRLLIVAGLIAGVVIYLLSFVTSIWVTIPILLALGALTFTLMPVSEAYIINQTSESNRSTILGVYYAASRGGSGFLILGLGYLIAHYGFGLTFTITGIAMLVIAATCTFLIWTQNRKS
jgi:predicted MFS family arabinose efflux permease